MQKNCFLIAVVIIWFTTLCETLPAQESNFEYPYYLLDKYNPDGISWTGMDPNGYWPVEVIPEELLVGEPPTLNVSGVTIPIDHWIELLFRGQIVDGPGDDIFMVELDSVGEQALVFLTDGNGREYLLGYGAVPNTNEHGPKTVSFDISGISLPFVPRAVRILGIDLRGGSPGFDLAYVQARIRTDCRNNACSPSPPDGTTNVPLDVILSWTPGYSAHKHVVFFGTSPVDVGPNATPVEIPEQPQDDNYYNPGGLELGKTYYWRIDEVNDSQTWTGDIWKFTVTDYIIVDDFESYNEVNNNWIKIPKTTEISVVEPPEPLRNSQQSLIFRYDFDGSSYSEAAYHFDPAQNWASIGAKSLELFFHGLEYNDSYCQMYLVLDDGDQKTIIPYQGDANDITKEFWQPWRIDLQNIDNINLGKIESIAIGFDNIENRQATMNLGYVYFDDIRLYCSRCLEEIGPKADLNNDCKVDYKDLEEIADQWLVTGGTVTAPGNPVAWYKFDGNADDGAGSADGRIYGNPIFVQGIDGQALQFDGFEDTVFVSDATGIFSKISNGITIAFWANGTNSTHHTDTLFCTDFSYNEYDPAIAINLGCWKEPGRYNWDCGYPRAYDNRLSGEHRYIAEWKGRWNHWAFMKNAITGEMQIYLNGILFDSRKGANSPVSGITSFQIGSGWYGGYDGLIDDFRIYDYVLSKPEIGHIMTSVTGTLEFPLITPADLFPDNRIDFRDFAILAESWLKVQYYP